MQEKSSAGEFKCFPRLVSGNTPTAHLGCRNLCVQPQMLISTPRTPKALSYDYRQPGIPDCR
jgi:hypothetical protein